MLGKFTNAILAMIAVAVTPGECDVLLFLFLSHFETIMARLGVGAGFRFGFGFS